MQPTPSEDPASWGIQALTKVVVGSKVACRLRTGATRQTMQRYEAKGKSQEVLLAS